MTLVAIHLYNKYFITYKYIEVLINMGNNISYIITLIAQLSSCNSPIKAVTEWPIPCKQRVYNDGK